MLTETMSGDPATHTHTNTADKASCLARRGGSWRVLRTAAGSLGAQISGKGPWRLEINYNIFHVTSCHFQVPNFHNQKPLHLLQVQRPMPWYEIECDLWRSDMFPSLQHLALCGSFSLSRKIHWPTYCNHLQSVSL